MRRTWATFRQLHRSFGPQKAPGLTMTAIEFTQPISLLHAGIIRRVDVVELYRRLPVDLDHSLSGRRGVVVHAGIEVGEAAGAEAHHLSGIEAVAHSNFQGPREHGDVLPVGMGMR